MAKEQKQPRKVLAVPIYVLIEPGSVVLPSAKLEFVTPDELPNEGSYYVMTAEGLHKSQDTKIVKALTPVKSLDVLATFQQVAKLRLPKIPRLILARAAKFFKKVYAKEKAESELMLLYQSSSRQFDLWCPTQEVSFGGVDYKLADEMQAIRTSQVEWEHGVSNADDEWKVVGTIHSHADFGAYHSGTDLDDEASGYGDGVHITVGHVNREEFSLSCSIAIGGKRWKVPQENILLGVTLGEAESKRYGVNATTSDAFFQIQLSEEEQAAMDGPIAKQIEEEWLPRVEKKTYTHQTWHGGGSTTTTYVRGEDEKEFEEDEEGGEWELRSGKWVFVSDEQLVEEADVDLSEQLVEEADANLTEAEKNSAIADAGGKEDDGDQA